jgi:hypothetical protein
MFQQSNCVNETMSLKKFFGTGTAGDDCGLNFLSRAAMTANQQPAKVPRGISAGRSCDGRPHATKTGLQTKTGLLTILQMVVY